MIEREDILDWPPECNRDSVAREIDRLRLDDTPQSLLIWFFDLFWPPTEPPDFRPGRRMRPYSAKQLGELLAAKLGKEKTIHENTIRNALKTLEGFIESRPQDGALPPLRGVVWERFFHVHEPPPTVTAADLEIVALQRATVAQQTVSTGVGSEIVALQNDVVGLQFEEQSTDELLSLLRQMARRQIASDAKFDQLQAEVSEMRSVLIALGTLTPAELTTNRSVLSDLKVNAQPAGPDAFPRGLGPVCSQNVALQQDVVGLQSGCSPTTSRLHEFMKNSNSIHEVHETPVTVGLQTKNVALQRTVKRAGLAFPDPYYKLQPGHLRNNEVLEYLLEWCIERHYWPAGTAAKIEFWAIADFSLGAEHPGEAFRTAIERQCYGRNRRVKIAGPFLTACERLSLPVSEWQHLWADVKQSAPPTAAPPPVITMTKSIHDVTEEEYMSTVAQDYWDKQAWRETREKGGDPKKNPTVRNALKRAGYRL